MEILRARTAGFCMGVSLALKKLRTALEKWPGAPIRTLGPIIHNPQVLAAFEKRGVVCLNDAREAQAGDHVLIRAHGVPCRQEAWLRETCGNVIDATCPKVKKAQLAIAAATRDGATLLLFGEAHHPEVAGLVSYASGPAHVFGSEAELERLLRGVEGKYVLASQTTQDRGAFEKIAAKMESSRNDLVVLSTICDATGERQAEALAIARQVECMVVVGGRQSGNTRRLASLAAGAGIETFHVEEIGELEAEKMARYSRIGLTAGASTPAELIDEAERWLLAAG